MKVLVTGSAGLPGRDVLRLLESRGVTCLGVDAPEFDATDSEAVFRLVEDFSPDVIVHCAAYSNVDKAESEPATCAGVTSPPRRSFPAWEIRRTPSPIPTGRRMSTA